MGKESAIIHMFRQSIALKEKWRRGEPSALVWVTLADPAAAEILAGAGFDAAIIDAEHCPFNPNVLQSLMMAFKGSSTVPIVRVPIADQWVIKAILDIGACGILLPLIRTADEARAGVAACRYPPHGIRGVAARRAADYGREFQGYLALADEAILRIVQIETAQAVENLDQILAVDGLDAILIGPADLSASLGHLGDILHPQVQRTIAHIVERARRANVPVAIAPPGGPEEGAALVRQGISIVTCGSDTGFIAQGAARRVARFYELVAEGR